MASGSPPILSPDIPLPLNPVFSVLPSPYLLLTPELVMVAASDAYLAATHTRRDTLLGQYLFDAFPDNPATPQAQATRNLRASLRQVLATGQPHTMPRQRYDVPDPDHPGQFLERYWLPRNAPVLDAAGRITHLLHAVEDVTEQVEAEHELRISQALGDQARAEAEAKRQRFYEVLMHLPAQVATYHGSELTYTFVNPRYQRYFPGRLLLGQPLRHMQPNVAGQGIIGLLERVYQTGEPYHGNELEVWIDFADSGQPRQVFLDVFFHPLRNAQGQIDGVLDFSYDVTEQVRARRELQQLNTELEGRVAARTGELTAALREAEQQRSSLQTQQRMLQQIMGQVPAAIATLAGPEHRYLFANDAYQALTGGRVQIGQPVREVLPELAAQGFVGLLDEVYRSGEPTQGIDMPLQLRDAESGQLRTRYADFIYQPLVNVQDQPEGILAFIVDVTARVQARQRADALQAEAAAAARRLAEEREKFYHVFADTPAAICIHQGPEHRYEYANVAYQSLFEDRQLLGSTVAEAVPEAAEAGAIALLDRVYQTGETHFEHEFPLLVRQPNGLPPKQMYFTFTAQAYREQGQIAGISTVAYEVTEQVLLRRQHEATQQRLYRLVMEAPAAICILDGPDLVFELVNPPCQQLFQGRELLGKPLAEALPELAEHPVMGMFRQVYETGTTLESAAMLVPIVRLADGVLENRYFNYIQQARRNADGQVDGVLVFAFEVTEQVRARQASEASTRQLRLLTDSLPVLIGYLDREERYRFANQAYEAWFGRKPADMLGRTVREIVGEPAYQRAAPYIARALAGERVDFDLTMPYRPGFTKHIHTSYIPDVRDGQVLGFYTLVADVTEQVEARAQVQQLNAELEGINDELNKSNTQLTHTNVDLDNFIYTASHDLRAPITNIEGLLQTLQAELEPPAATSEVPYILELMHDSVERFKTTIDHLTDVSKLQREYGQAAAPVALGATIEDVLLDLTPLLREAHAQLTVSVQAVPTVNFAAKNLRSVLYNLISNALKYRHPDRPALIAVRARRTAGQVVLEVEDNGLGIDLNRANNLFGMFQRLHTHVEGSGVGLFMVKRMVENAGGQITVESEVGKGSTFSVFLPS